MRQKDSTDYLKSHDREQNPGSPRPGMRGFRWLALAAMAMLVPLAFAFQDSPALHAVSRGNSKAATAKHRDAAPAFQNADDYKPLMDELTHLQEKLIQGVQFPAPRTQSRLLPLMPSSSSFFVALPNYGEVLNQANQIFHQELQESPVLSDFWRNKVGPAGLIVDGVIDQVHKLFQFLGDEIVVTGNVTQKGGSVIVVTETRKPGLKAFIQQLIGQYGNKTRPPVVVYTPQQLAAATKQPSQKPLLMLVRPDYVVVGSDLPSLRRFNAQLNRGGGKFSSGSFGEKIAQQYQNGAAVVFGADLYKLLNLLPHDNGKNDAMLSQSGLTDVRYLAGEGQYANGVASTNVELSFAGPRKGIAAWLGGPTALTGLDFISPDASYAGAFNFENFGQIFDDIKGLAGLSNPSTDAGLEQLETQFKIRLKDDLFSKLSGQIAFALDGPIMPSPAWKVMAQLSDASGLERTLKQLIALAGTNLPEGMKVEQETRSGVNYYAIHFPNSPKPVEFAFADGFLVVAASRGGLEDAIRTRRSGNSLARSTEFQDLLPRDAMNAASGIIYQNLGKVLGSMGQQVPPDQAQLFELMARYSKPSATALYGTQDAIRMASRSKGMDPSAALVMAAVTIPNLTRQKKAATEMSALSTVRTLTSAEAQYQYTYADRGYAPDLATLGPNPDGDCPGNAGTQNHACLIDANLGCTGSWCDSNSFRFNITGKCHDQVCDDYVIVAVPISPNAGGRNFCSTSEGQIRAQSGAPLKAAISVTECQTWQPL